MRLEPEVLLIQPPFAPLERPSMGLSLLKPGLQELGISCQIHYANFDFAEQIGMDDYQLAPALPMQLLTGEWVFSAAAFPEFQCDEAAYYAILEPGWPQQPALLQRLRQLAPAFVENQARQIVERGPRIVGCSSVFAQHCASLALLRAIKALDPNIITVLGGSNCEGCMGEMTHRRFAWVDYVVSGEADFCFPALCRDLLQGKQPSAPGVWGPGQSQTAGRAQVLDLDRTQRPDFHEYFERLQRSSLRDQIRPTLMVETSRGCWWGAKHHCTFCGLNGQSMNFRSKSPGRVLEELDYLAQTYSLSNFEAVDNILDMGYLDTVFPALIESGRQYSIFYETKVNLRHDQLRRMAQAGVRSLQPGIESLDDRVLALMDKGTTALQNVQLLKWARELGIYIVWNVLYGFPGEEDDWYGETLASMERLMHLQAPIRMARVRYDRYSPYHYQSEKYQVKLRPSRCYRFIYPLPEEELEDLAVFFEDAPGSVRSKAGPQVLAMGELITRWSQLFQGGPPILSMEDDGQRLTILDTRPCALEFLYTMEEPARSLYLECDRARSRRSLYELGSRLHGLDSTRVDPIIEEWERRRLVLQKGPLVLALAVSGELPGLSVENSGLATVMSAGPA